MARLSKEELSALFAQIEEVFKGKYHSIYERLGLVRCQNGNYHCPNTSGHSDGKDSQGSFSICNDTGMWQCFACQTKGNLYVYWKDYINNGRDHFHEFMKKEFNIGASVNDRDIMDMKSLLKDFDTGTKKAIVEMSTLKISCLEEYTNNLIDSPERLEYIFKTRHLGIEDIRKYRIGINEYGAYTIPMITVDGSLINIKQYNPTKDRYKWSYRVKGGSTFPFPIDNFAQNTLYIFEGEPDALCAIGFGIPGAVTIGSVASASNLEKTFGGVEVLKSLIAGKEIVICLDTDQQGRDASIQLAEQMNPYARQIKIIDLDTSDMNKHGLDPSATKDVGGKQKRSETDFTDFMKKNGFDKSALDRFYDLVDATPAYTDSKGRLAVEYYKVTIEECRSPKYHSYSSIKKLIVTASVSEIDDNAYMYYKEFPVVCHGVGTPVDRLPKSCAHCSLPMMEGFEDADKIVMHFYRDGESHEEGRSWIKISENDVLGLIETRESAKMYNIKQLCGINARCTSARITTGLPQRILRATLIPDVVKHEITEGPDGDKTLSNVNVSITSYIISPKEVSPGQSYVMEGVQAISPNGQHIVLVVDRVENNNIKGNDFVMTSDIHESLKVFRPKTESVDDIHSILMEKYGEFSRKDRFNRRDEIYFLNDLVLFCQHIMPRNDYFAVDRGWVEIAISGESRCGKSKIPERLFARYGIGEKIESSSSVSRSGILGGITKQMKGQSKITWGALPRNDKGYVHLDEMHSLNPSIISDMTASRSSGIVDISMSMNGRAYARTAKTMVCNPAEGFNGAGCGSEGYEALKSVFMRDEVMSRFDIAYYVKAQDYDMTEFSSTYSSEGIVDRFSDIAVRNHINWQTSIKSSNITFEEGYGEHIMVLHNSMLKKYDPRTQLVNQEARVKITRCAISLAKMLYSTPDNSNPEKVVVKKVHATYIAYWMDRLYSHSNMRLDVLSNQWKKMSSLGDMRFMENIVKYIDIQPLINESKFTKESIHQIYYDYLELVEERKIAMEGGNGERRKIFVSAYHGVNKLISVMISRNCLTRGRGSIYNKTPMFDKWLFEIKDKPKHELSNVLEVKKDESSDKIYEELKRDGLAR